MPSAATPPPLSQKASPSSSLVAAGIAAFESEKHRNITSSMMSSVSSSAAPVGATFITPMKGKNASLVTATATSAPSSSPPFSPSTPPPPPPSADTDTVADSIRTAGKEEEFGENNEQSAGGNYSNNNNIDVEVSEEEEDDDDVDDEEWEDFMANYWKSIGNNNNVHVSSSTSKAIVDMEDTDMKPCEIEPDLDEELNALSAIRTGCMDIDMDFDDDDDDDDHDSNHNSYSKGEGRVGSSSDDAGMNQLSMVGLECSRAMANIVVAIVNDSSNTGINRDTKKKNGMEGLRIDVGRIERGWGDGGRRSSVGGAKDARSSNSSKDSPSERRTTGEAGNDVKSTSPSSISSSSPNSHRQRLTEGAPVAADTSEVSSTLPSSTMTTLAAPQSISYQHITTSQQQQLDAASNVDIDDSASVGRKSTKSSNTGAEEGGTNHSKNKTSPLPLPEYIHATGPIMTRTSLRSLVMKKWHPSYWMQYRTHELLIFRSKDHMDDWRYNPYHGKKQRDFLVKLHIDFMADMVPAAATAAEGGVGGGSKGNSSTKDGILGHRVLPVKKKSYGKNEDEM